jgi:uncharacterized membrane protein
VFWDAEDYVSLCGPMEHETPARAPRTSAPLLAALALLAAGWLFVVVAVDEGYRDSDTPIYERYGRAMVDGEVPYRDFAVEYPPGALVTFVVPAALSDAHFALVFELLLGGCAVVLVVATWLALRRLELDRRDALVALLATAAAPVALATVSFDRYDLWPAALVALWLAAELHGRRVAAPVLLAAAVTVKLYPVVLVPLALARTWRTQGRAAAVRWAAVFAGTAAAVVLPFLALAPDGLVESIRGQLSRPLQLESLASSLLLATDKVADLSLGTTVSHGSVNLVGSTADAAASATTALQVLLVAGVWWIALRAREWTPLLLVTATGAALVALVVAGKVFSPQFLLWLVPAALLGALRPVRAAALLLAAALLTVSWFPFRYGALVEGESVQVASLVLRNALVVWLAVEVLRALVRRRAAPQPRQPPVSPL